MNKNGIFTCIWQLSPKIPFTRLNIVCREIRKITGEGTILDLGCGNGKSTQLILGTLRGNYAVTGLDAFLPGILQAKESGTYTTCILFDLKRQLPFVEKAFDIVLLLEVLEHLPREEGKKLLIRMEEIARKGVVISTPAYLDRTRNGTEAEDTAYNLQRYRNEPWRMPHITIWTEDDYQRYGYNVKRVNGMHVLRLPHFLNIALGVMSSPFSYLFFTGMPTSFVAVKELERSKK